MLLGALDATIVGPAMPNIVRELGGMSLLSWVFTIYSLTSTITIPIVGKLSDLYGRKWFYLGGITHLPQRARRCREPRASRG